MDSTLYLGYSIIGATLLLLALAASPIKDKLWISEPLLATGVGVIVGPHVTGLLDPSQWGDEAKVLEELARITLAISLMGAAFRLPHAWIFRNWRPVTVLLLAAMPLMWLVSGLCAWLILDLPVLQALLLGALITPTDPVVAGTIVTGKLAEKYLSADIRHLITSESGANDGLAFLFVMLPALLLDLPASEAWTQWSTRVLFREVLGSIFLGALAGWLAGKALRRIAKAYPEEESLLSVTMAFSIALLGVIKLLDGDGILGVFAAGIALNWALHRGNETGRETSHEHFQENLKRFFEAPVFIFFGMVMPVEEWLAMGPRLWLFAAAILLFRRIPAILVLRPFLHPLHGLRESLFVGWFGPVAVAAMVYATWADVREGYEQLWVVTSLVIFVSVVIHGMTATPFVRMLSGGKKSDPR